MCINIRVKTCKALSVPKTREALTVLSARAAVFIMKFAKELGFAEDSVLDGTGRPLSQRREHGGRRGQNHCHLWGGGGSARNGLESAEGGRGMASCEWLACAPRGTGEPLSIFEQERT